ncbi:uncharacterized protein LOC105772014 [Gossypium raimondii]|uniref:uncharacterized protein LOC105772014 n=1 Tax=Gossypium raimondii TaxID=29730 RepID=UPI00063AEB19|nr:uncharacterized protein LOC105772014 [Gossypium raimondii]
MVDAIQVSVGKGWKLAYDVGRWNITQGLPIAFWSSASSSSEYSSPLVAEKLVHKGCEAFLALVHNLGSIDSSVGDIRTIKEFPYVFPEELPWLPPDREIQFGIKILLGTASVSIAPYRMAPKELMELKA